MSMHQTNCLWQMQNVPMFIHQSYNYLKPKNGHKDDYVTNKGCL